jgi:hypothetical protein
MAINSREHLIQYALRKLGSPVINIEIAQEQTEDRIDEALQFFQDFHYDGTERVYLKHQITGTEIVVSSTDNFILGEMVRSSSGASFQIDSIDFGKLITKTVYKNGSQNGTFLSLETIVGLSSGATTTVIAKNVGDIENRFVPVSDMVTGVIRAIPWFRSSVNNNSTAYLFDPQYQMVMSTFQSLASSSMIYYQQAMSHISLMDQVLRPIDSIRFNRKTSNVYLDFDWTTANIGGFLIFECYRILDPEVFTDIYNDRMLKKLVTAKFKYQWASNCQKYQGIQLLGGVTVDATTLMAQAVAEIEAAETEIRDAYSEGPIGFIG